MKGFSKKEIEKAEKEKDDVAVFNMRSFNIDILMEEDKKKEIK